MRRRLFVIALIAALFAAAGPRAVAEDEPKPEQLKQMYDDTLAQLKSAQERKTQLAAENEQLKAKVAELEKQLKAASAKSAELDRQAAGYAEKTVLLGSRYAAGQEL